MVRVIVGTTTQRQEKNYPANTTVRTILEDSAIDYSVSQIMLNGSNLEIGTMDKPISDLGFDLSKPIMLIAVVKAANA